MGDDAATASLLGRQQMLFMVIERFKNQDLVPVYRRFAERGRMMPDGLEFVDSWVDTDAARCFQLMKTDNRNLFAEWIAAWEDLADFEIIPVVPGREVAAAVLSQ